MDTKEIQKLLDYISKSDLEEVNIETSELKLSIKRSGTTTSVVMPASIPAVPAATPVPSPAPAAAVASEASAPVATENKKSNLIEIKSPMIGTFYRAGGPGKPNFVNVGDTIEEGKVICIIEAMKLFNEIESEISGKIVEVLVEDATPVEFDQPLFLVEPA